MFSIVIELIWVVPLDASPGAPMTSGAMMYNVLFVGELLLVSVQKPE